MSVYRKLDGTCAYPSRITVHRSSSALPCVAVECIRTRRQVTRGLEDESPRDKYDLSVDGTDLSKLYKQARPTLPDFVVQDVIAYVNQKLPKRELCIDVGCGPGQSTELFCPYFKNVVGADISHSQIEEANAMRRHGNVTYMEAHAECLPLRSNSVALVSAVNAIQWFDQDAFFAEVRRVLVQNGVLFAAMHHLRALLEPGMDNWLSQVYCEMPQLRKTMLNNSTLTVSDVMSHINTWSLVIMMREQEPARAKATLAEFRDRILSKMQRYPEEDPVLNVAFMTSYVMCRK
ncbi:hypothetical protein HPB49_017555 [Dermacentor silvarum]|uniref:Uncharacterized protein n=1 Tax=Dermacentor silvarum TaxID=543639 RepID=A0ACB8D735_DERSI|nr:hypothetical protein HPB49_017555 [Dermacentor silvarum]